MNEQVYNYYKYATDQEIKNESLARSFRPVGESAESNESICLKYLNEKNCSEEFINEFMIRRFGEKKTPHVPDHKWVQRVLDIKFLNLEEKMNTLVNRERVQTLKVKNKKGIGAVFVRFEIGGIRYELGKEE